MALLLFGIFMLALGWRALKRTHGSSKGGR
jgi:hypothetical protein